MSASDQNAESQMNAREFFERFLDDYYADCDEHLRSARHHLMDLERGEVSGDARRELVESLFRSFHTIKGLSGMVGLTQAESLAHQLESCLAAVRQGRLQPDPTVTRELEAGVQQLEQVINARRTAAAIPDVSGHIGRLAALLTGGPASTASPPPATAPAAAPTATPAPPTAQPKRDKPPAAALWQFTYVPSPELAQRGLSVENLRSRLQALGQVLKAQPQVQDGKVAFVFTVATSTPEANFAELLPQGVTWQAAPASPEPSARPAAQPHAPSTPPSEPVRVAGVPALAQSNFVRVDLARLDELMRLVGELVTSRARLADQLQGFNGALAGPVGRALQETSQALERQLRDLREAIMRVRLVPIGEAFERMQFVVRDLMRESGRQVRLELRGQQTQLDKLVVERMLDPLLHLVRNALSHGIESPEERLAAGKPAEGRLTLSATTAGDTVILEIADDGRGIRREEVAARARALGLWGEGPLDDTGLLDVLCAPGFSTRPEADRAAGRGVGMGVVRNAVHALGGHLSLQTAPGQGTRFVVQLPLTLLIVDALIVSVGGQTLAVPQPALREILQADPAAVRTLENNEVLPYRDGALPLIHLARLFGWPAPALKHLYVLVVGAEPNTAGLVVERIIGQREIVVRALSDPLVRSPGIAGATELSDGRAILILDTAALLRLARGGVHARSRQVRQETPSPTPTSSMLHAYA